MMLSVIIPTLNAGATLESCLAALQPGAALIHEIIIVDGSSTDTTLALAAGTRVLRAPPSRGGQFRTGIAAATSSHLLLLHADTILSANWPAAVQSALSPDTAHYFRFRLNSPARAARLLEHLVALRCRLLRLPYGDQALLISRELLNSIGGMPDLPLMEDVALARRLNRRLRPLPACALTSAARYQRGGWLRRPLRNLLCLTLYYCGVPPARIRRLYG